MKRQEFLEKLKAEHRMFGFKNLIYVDETGFDAHCNRSSAWVAKGQKILGLVSGERKRRTNLIMAKDYHYLIPLPPYSPDFNPIEKTFGAMKKRRQGMPEGTTIDQLIMSYS